jgi:hypothetical protein
VHRTVVKDNYEADYTHTYTREETGLLVHLNSEPGGSGDE